MIHGLLYENGQVVWFVVGISPYSHVFDGQGVSLNDQHILRIFILSEIIISEQFVKLFMLKLISKVDNLKTLHRKIVKRKNNDDLSKFFQKNMLFLLKICV